MLFKENISSCASRPSSYLLMVKVPGEPDVTRHCSARGLEQGSQMVLHLPWSETHNKTTNQKLIDSYGSGKFKTERSHKSGSVKVSHCAKS